MDRVNKRMIAQELVAVAKELTAARRLSYRKILNLGKKISGGMGFWGRFKRGYWSGHPDPDILVEAWVDALRSKGYEDADIILYGDWSDGRHISDYVENDTDYAEFKKIVRNNSRSAADVKNSRNEYSEEKLDVLRRAGLEV